VASSELARKVSAWHEMIAPRLERVEKRSEFDIHAYGTRILQSFGGQRGAVRSFGQLMTGRPKEEVGLASHRSLPVPAHIVWRYSAG